MRRAYRRPVTEADLQTPFKFYQEARAESGFEAGIEMGLRAVLVSPEFLFRVEQDPAAVADWFALSHQRSGTWRRACRSSCGAVFRTMNYSMQPFRAS